MKLSHDKLGALASDIEKLIEASDPNNPEKFILELRGLAAKYAEDEVSCG
jgi:hypothetical protein